VENNPSICVCFDATDGAEVVCLKPDYCRLLFVGIGTYCLQHTLRGYDVLYQQTRAKLLGPRALEFKFQGAAKYLPCVEFRTAGCMRGGTVCDGESTAVLHPCWWTKICPLNRWSIDTGTETSQLTLLFHWKEICLSAFAER